MLIRFFGGVRKVDMRIDQEYLRSQPVNSEEGTPMGIGVWYEMAVSDPVEYLFRNTDPRGSLRANVRNAAVRCLSNMPLQSLLEDRHSMSHRVRDEVSPKSIAWGYQLGSVYIRKVHFRDQQMIQQIEQKWSTACARSPRPSGNRGQPGCHHSQQRRAHCRQGIRPRRRRTSVSRG